MTEGHWFDDMLYRGPRAFQAAYLEMVMNGLQRIDWYNRKYASLWGLTFNDFPATFGTWTSLTSIHLSEGLLIGAIPDSIKHLRSLKVLELSRNRFDGTEIPASIMELAYLEVLMLDGCGLTGRLSVAFVQFMKTLKRYSLRNNQLSYSEVRILDDWGLTRMLGVGVIQFINTLKRLISDDDDRFDVSKVLTALQPPLSHIGQISMQATKTKLTKLSRQAVLQQPPALASGKEHAKAELSPCLISCNKNNYNYVRVYNQRHRRCKTHGNARPTSLCSYHKDHYPAGGDQMQAPRRGNGSDWSEAAPYRMYHGDRVPGFPQHPHRGFETIMCTIEGLIDHTDSTGCAGRYGNGDLQWMTAGKGVVHGEMLPLIKQTPDGNVIKWFQIWLNLPKKSKMVDTNQS
ncbi:hypothetical protein BJ741DRAFT_668236 [Chytriomyces cf. hyalinus JEL632]|nr:hypothetical protein BJ741DRAFT_668236 [Chytriomyces cf. hyalinus JEL632]